jgi:hypothetical protein
LRSYRDDDELAQVGQKAEKKEEVAAAQGLASNAPAISMEDL